MPDIPINETIHHGVDPKHFRRNVVLFGAGASNGCGHVEPSSPPLGGYVYHALKEYSSAWATLRPELDDAFIPLESGGEGRNFERGMAKLVDALPLQYWDLLREMGYFFCRFHTDRTGKDAYSCLVRGVRNVGALPQMLFATLNYDHILEDSSRQVGVPVYPYRTNPPPGDALWLYKLHGSCTAIPRNGEESVPEFVTPDEVAARLGADPGIRHQYMSLYMPGKLLSGSTAGWFKAMYHDWARMIRAAENVLMIGVAPPRGGELEEDLHVFGPIKSTEAAVFYVGFPQEYDRLVGFREGRPCIHLGTSFADAIDAIVSVVS